MVVYQRVSNTSLASPISFGEGCAKPSLPIGKDPIPIPLFCMSRLKVCEHRNPH